MRGACSLKAASRRRALRRHSLPLMGEGMERTEPLSRESVFLDFLLERPEDTLP
jgi:hypothetical protein